MTDRHQCEVRYLLALTVKDRAKVSGYLETVEKKRGTAAAQKLRQDARQQWDLGNRGKWGDWR